MNFTCIMCPNGCPLEVLKDEKTGEIIVKGNGCPRGEIFGKKELTSPERMVTTIKKYKKGTISLRLDKPIAKNKVDDCLKEIEKSPEPKNVFIGDTIIKNICSTNCNVIVTNINN